MIENAQKTKKRGRPSISVSWPPTTVFTVKDVSEASGKKLTDASIRMKVRSAVDSGELSEVGKSSYGVGRPRRTYKVNTTDAMAD
jgi:hypothetical protein